MDPQPRLKSDYTTRHKASDRPSLVWMDRKPKGKAGLVGGLAFALLAYVGFLIIGWLIVRAYHWSL